MQMRYDLGRLSVNLGAGWRPASSHRGGLGSLFNVAPAVTAAAQMAAAQTSASAGSASSQASTAPVSGDIGDKAMAALYSLNGGYAYLRGGNGCEGWIIVSAGPGPGQWSGGSGKVLSPVLIAPDVACALSAAINNARYTPIDYVLKNGPTKVLVRLQKTWLTAKKPFTLHNALATGLREISE